MGEKPQRIMSVDMGRRFMCHEQHWFDIDMVKSSQGLVIPSQSSPATEKVKYTLCCQAKRAVELNSNRMDPDGVLAHLWYHHGFLNCSLKLHGGIERPCLISVRGICWLEPIPVSLLDTDTPRYNELMHTVEGVRRDIRHLIKTEFG